MAPQIFIKILYTELNILIGNMFGDLSQQIGITVKIRAVNYLNSIMVLFKGLNIFSEVMLLYCPCINCCDKLMALLLFYSVIKFLLITLTQRSSKGQAVSWGNLQSCQEKGWGYMADIKRCL